MKYLCSLSSLRNSVNNKLPVSIQTFGEVSSLTFGRYKYSGDSYSSMQLSYNCSQLGKSFHYLITPHGVQFLEEEQSTGTQKEIFLIRA